MRVLITGGCGFVGSHLVEELALNKDVDEIYIVDNLCEGKIENLDPIAKTSFGYKLRFVGGDIRYQLPDKFFRVVYHLAALHSVPKSFQHPQKYFESNIIGTWNVLSKYSGGSTTIVNISSSSAKECLSPYAISKATAEKCAELFKKTVSLRLFNVFGERQPETGCIVPAFCRSMIARKQPVIYGNGKQTRDFTYVKDVVRMIADYGQHSCATGTYDIGYGQSISVMDMFNKIAKLTKFNGKPMQMAKRKGDIEFSMASEAMKSPRYGFDKGLERTVEYFREKISDDKKLVSLNYSGKWRYGDG